MGPLSNNISAALEELPLSPQLKKTYGTTSVPEFFQTRENTQELKTDISLQADVQDPFCL